MKNKTIIFIGGYGYLASSIVTSLTNLGANVFVLGKDYEKFKQVFKKDVKNQHLNFIQCDANKTSEIKVAFEKVKNDGSKIDVLINGAFGVRNNDPINISDSDWEYSIDSSLNSIHKAIREVIPYFYHQGKGKIINISSMYGVVAPDFEIYKDFPNYLNPPHYGVAKAGVIQLTKYYASFLGKKNITVNSVSPGPFPSLEVQKNKKFVENLKSKTCLNRIGKPEDLIGIFNLLCTNSSDFITGQNFIIDGGWTIK